MFRRTFAAETSVYLQCAVCCTRLCLGGVELLYKEVQMGHCRRLYGCAQVPYQQGHVNPVTGLNRKHCDSSTLCNLPCVSCSTCFTGVEHVVWADPEWTLNAIWHQESKAMRKITSIQKKDQW